MILKDGKFYEGDKIVPLEFGNKEQIRLMNEELATLNALQNNGLIVEPDIEAKFTAIVREKCLCGTYLYFENDDLDEDDPISAAESLDGMTTTCRGCKRKYKLSIDSDGDLLMKLLKEEKVK